MNTPPLNLDRTKPTVQTELLNWLPVIIGLAVLYVPSLIDLFKGIWSSDEQLHGPIVLGISLWLLYRNWAAMELAAQGQRPSAWGWPIFVFGLLLYALGRSQDILLFEIGSVIWLLVGLLLLQRGTKALKAQWFALFFMLFMVPLPGRGGRPVTMPMKMAVSYVAEHVLFWVGTPLAATALCCRLANTCCWWLTPAPACTRC
jgi:exosortase